ncbi:MAG: hypothetical protein GY711_20465 [bacterium]|nr:hypothetical protein [bacterium]
MRNNRNQWALVASTMLLAACSSSSSGDDTAPRATSFVQKRGVDITGQTLDIRFNDDLKRSEAEDETNFTLSGGINVLTASLRGGDTVRLTLDALAIPGTHTVSISSNIEDTSGNDLDAVNNAAITSSDTTAPSGASIAGTTIEGNENDTIAVVFSDDMISSEVTSTANWNLESPQGTPFDITGAAIAYVGATRTATITLGAGSADQNLHTFDDVHVTFTTMRDFGGNVITATTIGVDAVNGMVGGDTTPPTLTAVAEGSGGTLNIRFSEHVENIATADLIGAVPVSGTRFIITDASDPGVAATGTFAISGRPADGDGIVVSDGVTAVDFEFDFGGMGTIAISGQPNDTDSVTLNDGVTGETFEFDSNATATGTSVTIGATAADTMNNLLTTINLSAINITAFAGGAATDIVVVNDSTGVAGNVAITNVDTAAVQTVTGMTGGGVAGGAITVAADYGDDTATVTDLRAQIDANAFDITTSAGGTALDFVLTNDASGTAGNVAITETDTNTVITIAGMSGGIDPGIATFEPTTSAAADAGIGATVNYAVTPTAGDALEIYGVTDLAGNQLFPTASTAVVAEDTDEPALDGGNSVVTAVVGERNDTVLVKFDDDVHPFGLMDPANYTVTQGTAIDLSMAEFSFNGTDEVSIAFSGNGDHNVQFANTYDLAIDNISSPQGVAMTAADSDLAIAPVGDNTAPTVGVNDARLDPVVADSILVLFDEPVDATAATTIAHYTNATNPATAAVLVGPRVVRLTFGVTPAVSDNLIIAATAQTDLAGNVAGAQANFAVQAADATAPTVTTTAGTAVANDGNDFIVVTFDEQVDTTSALTAANYAVTNGAAVDVTGATFTYSSTSSSVEIMLPDGVHLDPASAISITTSNVTDVAGNAIVAAAVAGVVGGDTTAPGIADAFANLRQDATNAVIDVMFDEDVDTTLATTIGNWAGSGGQAATAVTQLDGGIYRVTLDAPLGTTETLTASNIEDLAQNAAAPLVVNPTE